MHCPDNYDAYERYADQQESALDKLPMCEYCDFHIQDDYLWDIDGTLYHEKCAEKLFRKDAEYYEQ